MGLGSQSLNWPATISLTFRMLQCDIYMLDSVKRADLHID